MFRKLKDFVWLQIRKNFLKVFPELQILESPGRAFIAYNVCKEARKDKNVLINPPAHISNTQIGAYSYIAINSYISLTTIGKFCSIGPNLVCGWGIHPLNGISTHPMFFSTFKQNGMTLSEINKVQERKPIKIGNDVFIGANVTILDGVTIGDGAVIGAGAVVSKDIPPYAIAVGCPIRIIRYRLPEDIRNKLLEIKWWDFSEEKLKDVERMIFDVSGFVQKHDRCDSR